MGFITQAIAANFAPLLFLKFHHDYQITLGKIALISTCFFLTQLLVDLFCAKFVDKIGYRICIVASEVCSAAGLVGLAFMPDLLPEPFVGIILSVIVYAVGSGLIEVLCSPIVEACPFDNKEATMSLLHSFYCWGAVGTIVISTLFFAVFGMDNWKWLAVLWALVPAINIYNFATCPIEHFVDEGQGMGIKELFRKSFFWLSICLMICSGASELAMAQWASAHDAVHVRINAADRVTCRNPYIQLSFIKNNIPGSPVSRRVVKIKSCCISGYFCRNICRNRLALIAVGLIKTERNLIQTDVVDIDRCSSIRTVPVIPEIIRVKSRHDRRNRGRCCCRPRSRTRRRCHRNSRSYRRYILKCLHRLLLLSCLDPGLSDPCQQNCSCTKYNKK